MKSQLLTRSELAKMLSVHPLTIQSWQNKGLLKPLRFTKRTLRYRMSDVEKFLSEREKLEVA